MSRRLEERLKVKESRLKKVQKEIKELEDKIEVARNKERLTSLRKKIKTGEAMTYFDPLYGHITINVRGKTPEQIKSLKQESRRNLKKMREEWERQAGFTFKTKRKR